MFADFRKINELPIILKAALSDGVELSPNQHDWVNDTIKWLGFDLSVKGERERLLEFIGKDNGASLMATMGVGRKTYNAILLYLLNT
jgi:hypothetical protein